MLRPSSVGRAKRHQLEDLLAIAICATSCGAEGWVEMSFFAEGKKQGLETFLQLTKGIPSDDTLRRVISALPSDEFEAGFQRWAAAASNNNKEVYHQTYAAFYCIRML